MPTLSRYFIKAGLMYFVLALLLMLIAAAAPYINPTPALAGLRPIYLHLLMVGWVTQLIMGVIYWMFPKLSKEQPRGSEKLGWFVFIALNSGLALRVCGEFQLSIQPENYLGFVLALSAVLQLLAGWAFIVNSWGRVKER